MSTATATTQLDRETAVSRRTAGAAALAFAAILIVQNGALLSGAPMADAPASEAVAFFSANSAKASVASGLVAINLVFMLVLAAATRDIVRRSGGRRLWSDVGALAATALVAVFGATAVAQIAMVNLAPAGESAAFEALWALHNAALALAMPVVGATLLGLSMGLHDAGATRPWLRLLGRVGGGLLVAAGLFNVGIAGGSPLVFIGFAGFALWVVWLVVTGFELVRPRH